MLVAIPRGNMNDPLPLHTTNTTSTIRVMLVFLESIMIRRHLRIFRIGTTDNRVNNGGRLRLIFARFNRRLISRELKRVTVRAVRQTAALLRTFYRLFRYAFRVNRRRRPIVILLLSSIRRVLRALTTNEISRVLISIEATIPLNDSLSFRHIVLMFPHRIRRLAKSNHTRRRRLDIPKNNIRSTTCILSRTRLRRLVHFIRRNDVRISRPSITPTRIIRRTAKNNRRSVQVLLRDVSLLTRKLTTVRDHCPSDKVGTGRHPRIHNGLLTRLPNKTRRRHL